MATQKILTISQLNKDAEFQIALILGPLSWVVLYALKQPIIDITWPLAAPWKFLWLAGISPVLEELVFRGYVQSWCYQQQWGRHRWGSLSGANLATSVLFAISHGLYHSPVWMLLVFFPSLVFGYFRDRYQSTKPAIALHIFYNSGFFLLWAPTL